MGTKKKKLIMCALSNGPIRFLWKRGMTVCWRISIAYGGEDGFSKEVMCQSRWLYSGSYRSHLHNVFFFLLSFYYQCCYLCCWFRCFNSMCCIVGFTYKRNLVFWHRSITPLTLLSSTYLLYSLTNYQFSTTAF